ncbi:MAG: phosphatase PAP2 family protein [Caulobacteraceae bacterium]|nr:phosphatase PAP2 family protein [Caulobacteraceae bacterium]
MGKGWFAAALVALFQGVGPVLAQQFEAPPPAIEEHLSGYLPDGKVDYRAILPSPPKSGSILDNLDVSTVTMLQTSASPRRWSSAERDSEYLYPRFNEAFGSAIDRTRAPKLVRLLNRTEHDVAAATFSAKRDFARLRPYQRLPLRRVCGAPKPPRPDLRSTERSSYPSGHSAYGWAAALVLSRVAPEHEAQLLARAQDYELSRVICGAHFPSDVEAGRMLATEVVARLEADPGFEDDLTAAKAEHASLAK